MGGGLQCCRCDWSHRMKQATRIPVYVYKSFPTCACVLFRLHIIAQSGPVILVVLCHSHWSSQGGINDTCYENLLSVYVCVLIKLRITAQSGPVILVIIGHSDSSSQGVLRDQ